MLKGKKIWSIARVILLLSVLWLLFILTTFFLKRHESNLFLYVPKNHDLAITVQGTDLFEKTFKSTVIKAQDKEVIELFIKSLEDKKTTKKGKSTKFGIDYFSDLVLFKVKLDKQPITALMFHINNTTAFDKNTQNYLKPTNLAYRNKSAGIILLQDSNLINPTKLKDYATSILDGGKSSNSEVNEETFSFSGSNDYFNRISYLNSLKGTIGIENSTIKMNGNASLSKIIHGDLHYQLKPKGFHIDSKIIPYSLNDSVQAYGKEAKVKLPNLSGFSLNYTGLAIESQKDGVMPIPKIQLLLEFQEPFKIQKLKSILTLFKTLNLLPKEVLAYIENDEFNYEQISDRVICIGTDKAPKIEHKELDRDIQISGDLNALTTVSGSRLIIGMIRLRKEYQAFDQLFKSSRNIQIDGTINENKELHFSGNILFKKDHFPMNELFRFALVSELIN